MTDRRILIVLSGVFLIAAIPALFLTPRTDASGAMPQLQSLAAMVDQEQDHLTPAEVDSLLAAGADLTIFDLRDSVAYEAGHLPGATQTSVADLLLAPPDTSVHILLYSEGGVHAGQAWILLKAAGHSHVHTLLSSWPAWNAAHPQSALKKSPPPAKDQNNSRERERLNGEC